jgi:anti-anti-sigma factor
MLKISDRRVGTVVILDLSGRLDSGEGDVYYDIDAMLRDRIRGLARQGFTSVVLNLDGVGHVDKLGLGAMISAKRLVETMGGRLTLLNPGERLRLMLAVTKLAGRFEVFTSEREAVSACTVPPPAAGIPPAAAGGPTAGWASS